MALTIFAAAVISDGVDGYIARTQKLKTVLGSFLDPLADKLLLSASFITLALAPNIPFVIRPPLWLPILVISRDLILLLGSLLIHVITGNLKINPSYLGKLTTVFQMSTVLCVLLQFKYSQMVWNVAGFFTVISCFDYIMKGSQKLAETGNAQA